MLRLGCCREMTTLIACLLTRELCYFNCFTSTRREVEKSRIPAQPTDAVLFFFLP